MSLLPGASVTPPVLFPEFYSLSEPSEEALKIYEPETSYFCCLEAVSGASDEEICPKAEIKIKTQKLHRNPPKNE